MLPLLEEDLAELTLICCEGSLDDDGAADARAACAVVAAAARLPGEPGARCGAVTLTMR